jgi:aspartyl-tRNA(Asn)/glutamyl-tRNA(Gln) amidotransferase subunit A
LCGIVGFKPTKSRVPTKGAYPLSTTLDSVGPLAATVSACAAADAVLAGEKPWNVEPTPLGGLNVGILDGEPLSELDATVANRFEEALSHLGCAGARLSDAAIPALEQMAAVQTVATIATAEAYRIHERQLAAHGGEYDQFIRRRIEGGRAVSDAACAEMLRRREELVTEMDEAMSPFDVLVLPTTPIVAPTMDDISSDQAFRTANRLLLRNTAIANFFDLCAISLPIPGDGLPVGLMLFGRRGGDRRLFRTAASIERLLQPA